MQAIADYSCDVLLYVCMPPAADREVEQLLAGGRRGNRAAQQPSSSSKVKQGSMPEAGTIQQRAIDQVMRRVMTVDSNPGVQQC